MKKIAPTLQEMHREPPLRWNEADRKNARAELRALLAVARAARKLVPHGDNCGRGCGCLECDVARALARLDKVSR